jgi:porphobilinogen deaminase
MRPAVNTIVVGARGSRLAQIMAAELIGRLGPLPGTSVKLTAVMTAGDRDRWRARPARR